MNEPRIAELERQVEELASEVQRLRRAVDEAHASQAAASVAASEWEAMFHSLPDLVSVIDCDHRIVRLNRQMADRLNVSPEEAVGRPCYELVHASGSPPAFCPHALALRDGRPHAAEIYEPTLDAFFLVSASPFVDAAGRLAGTVHVIRELTQRGAEACETQPLEWRHVEAGPGVPEADATTASRAGAEPTP